MKGNVAIGAGAAIMLVATLLSPAAGAWDETRLPDAWKIQDATSPDVPPQEGRWTKTPQGDSRWLCQELEIPASWSGSRVFLDFKRIEGDAVVFMNSARVGELLRPGGEIEATSVAKAGERNTLAVFATRDYNGISRDLEGDPIRKAVRLNAWAPVPKSQWGVGVTGPTILKRRSAPVSSTGLFIQTSWREKRLSATAFLDATRKVEGLSLTLDIFDQNGKKALSCVKEGTSVEAGKSSLVLSSSWPDPVPWELDAPRLYSAQLTLKLDGKELFKEKPVEFGFREIWTEGRRMFMNGHETRWRLATIPGSAAGPGAIDYLRQIGYDAAYIPASPSSWWGRWNESPLFDEELLTEADKKGFALSIGAPSVSYLRDALLKDAKLLEDYKRETAVHVSRYWNHPSVLGWIVAMNSAIVEYDKREDISPQGMGRRHSAEVCGKGQPLVVETACKIVKSVDPTRLAFSTGDGNLGDMGTSCMYLNFAPLQEREEWPMEWSRTGDMPYMAYEFGAPYTANFWKGPRFLPTECFAIYFGDEAYKSETEKGLESLIADGLGNKTTHGCHVDWNAHPLYWKFQELFVRNTNRAFRMWGFNGGWGYFNVDTHYGIPPTQNPKENLPLYRFLNNVPKEAWCEKPSWANPNFEIHKQANQQLLAYLAGWPAHTDKTRAFYEGEIVEKSLAIAWDGPGDSEVVATWSLRAPSGQVEASGSLSSGLLKPGATKQARFAFKAPSSGKRSDFALELKCSAKGEPCASDSFAITVFPRPLEKSRFSSRFALFDPSGESTPWLRSTGLQANAWKPGDSLEDVDVLVIGRKALSPGDDMPFKPEDVERGLKVLVLEQLPATWKGLGFRTTEAMPRLAFVSDLGHPALKGLEPSDFQYWRGSSTLLPEGVKQPSEFPHAPKWTNTHAIASSVPQIPRCAGFTPLLAAEFDLDYSPLLEWRFGKGLVLFSALDFTGRAGSDPAASLLAANILAWLDSAAPRPPKKTAFSGDAKFASLLASLGVAAGKPGSGEELLIVGSGSTTTGAQVKAFVERGGSALCLAQSPEWLAALGVKTTPKKLRHADSSDVGSAFPALGPRYFRWRDVVAVDAIEKDPGNKALEVFADGTLAKLSLGKGSATLCQLSPELLKRDLRGAPERAQAAELSEIRLRQLIAALATGAGAEPSRNLAERLASVAEPPVFTAIGSWNTLGPFPVDKDDGEAMLSTKLPGEELAVKGLADPDAIIKRSDGTALDWRRVAKAREDGFVDLANVFKKKSLTVGYVATVVESASERDAVMRVGCDWRMILWVNGEEVFRTCSGKRAPDAYRVPIKLKKGKNFIGMKVASGNNGFSFYADISGAPQSRPNIYSDDLRKGAVLYGGALLSDEFDPYQFTYW